MQPIYTIEDICFQYPLQQHPIHISGNLQINFHDIILIQGSSGCGKSTLIMILAGIIPHLIQGKLSGKVLTNGKELINLDYYKDIHIGYLSQNQSQQFIFDMVYQELAFGLENLQLEPEIIEQKISSLSKEFGVTHLLNRKTSALSGGEKQKINLLSILLMEPQILLLDEPTSYLDPESAHEIISILKKYSQNKTIIIAEHNINYLHNFINRAITINNCEIHEEVVQNINFTPAIPLKPCKTNPIKQQNTLLSIVNLNFCYNYQPKLLDNVNLNINTGEIIGIIGKNGCGKSTLLKLISKVLPTKKSIYYKNQDIKKINAKNYYKEMVLLRQNPEESFLYDSVEKELDYDLEVIKHFQLEENIQQNPFCLSEGEKRRLSLAIAFKQQPSLFLLDEPTFGLDQKDKDSLANLISSVTLTNKSFIIVSHDLSFLHALTSNTYELKNGSLIFKNLS